MLAGELREIKRRLGGNSFRLVATGDLARIASVPGVAHVIPRAGADGDSPVKLLLEPDARGPEVLRQLVTFLEVREFRSQEPDLEEIFIQAVRDAA